MNGRDLEVAHGAPLRLRVKRQLGYKQAKYLTRIEVVVDLGQIYGGQGGFWEDRGYEWYAGISAGPKTEKAARGRLFVGIVPDQMLLVRMSRSLPKISSMWCFSTISGGDMAMVSPVVRIKSPSS
jgi:hypothetical protein